MKAPLYLSSALIICTILLGCGPSVETTSEIPAATGEIVDSPLFFCEKKDLEDTTLYFRILTEVKGKNHSLRELNINGINIPPTKRGCTTVRSELTQISLYWPILNVITDEKMEEVPDTNRTKNNLSIKEEEPGPDSINNGTSSTDSTLKEKVRIEIFADLRTTLGAIFNDKVKLKFQIYDYLDSVLVDTTLEKIELQYSVIDTLKISLSFTRDISSPLPSTAAFIEDKDLHE